MHTIGAADQRHSCNTVQTGTWLSDFSSAYFLHHMEHFLEGSEPTYKDLVTSETIWAVLPRRRKPSNKCGISYL